MALSARDGWSRLGLPPTDPFVRNLLLGLLGLYVVELVANVAGVPTLMLAWQAPRVGFAPWQVLTCYLVQGNNVGGVVFGLLGLWFLLPGLFTALPHKRVGEALLAAIAVGTALPLAANLLGLGAGVVIGWPSLLMALFCLFGLAFPEATVRINFVLPVTGPMIVWGSLLLAVLTLLASFGAGGQGSLGAFHSLGLWLGVYGWWHLRYLRPRSTPPPGRPPPRFRVYEGGQDSQRDVYHRSLA